MNHPIPSDVYAKLKSYLNEEVRILNAYMWGKWLKAELSSGVNFYVKVDSFKKSKKK